MIQLQINSGKTAGNTHSARRFPFVIGRSAKSDLCLEEDGVWERHAVISLERSQGFVVDAEPNALLSVNGAPVTNAVLRNGDQIVMGSAQIRFWLSEAKQRGLAWREFIAWFIILAVCLGQAAVIFWLW